MLFKSPVFSQASGSIAGITYSHNRSGMYTRARTVPTDPSTTRQAAQRMYLTQAASAWHSVLTSGQRDSWDTYAANTPFVNKLGDSTFLTGQQQWVRSATAGFLAGADPDLNFADAPNTFDYGDPGTIALGSASATIQGLVFSVGGSPAWAADDASNVLVFVSKPQNVSRRFWKGPYQFINTTIGDSGTPVTAFTITIPAGPNTFIAGQRLYAQLRVLQSDGRLGARLRFGVTASA